MYAIIIRIRHLSIVVFVVMIAWLHSADVFAQASTPYGGEPWPIPGIIEAEDFDLGGEGVAYHDIESVNNGGQDLSLIHI